MGACPYGRAVRRRAKQTQFASAGMPNKANSRSLVRQTKPIVRVSGLRTGGEMKNKANPGQQVSSLRFQVSRGAGRVSGFPTSHFRLATSGPDYVKQSQFGWAGVGAVLA